MTEESLQNSRTPLFTQSEPARAGFIREVLVHAGLGRLDRTAAPGGVPGVVSTAPQAPGAKRVKTISTEIYITLSFKATLVLAHKRVATFLKLSQTKSTHELPVITDAFVLTS